MSVMEDPLPPPLPIQLKLCMTEESRVSVVVERVVNSHYYSCPRRHEVAADCSDGLCRYFTWHLHHHTSHRPGGSNCGHCALYETWIRKHSSLYCRSPCGLSLCNEMKKQTVKNRWQTCVDGFSDYLKSPNSSLNRNGLLPRYPSVSSYGEPTTSLGSVHTREEDDDDAGRGYFSASTSCTSSANSSPVTTQTFEPMEDEEGRGPASEHHPSDVRQIQHATLYREPSVGYIQSDPLVFTRTQSESSRHSLHGKHRIDSRDSVEGNGATRDSVRDHCDLEDSLPLLVPQPNSSLGGENSRSISSRVPQSSFLTRQNLAGAAVTVTCGGKKRENFNSDSAIGSTSENEELSSMESVAECTTNTTTTAPGTFEDSTPCPTIISEMASTPSTVHVSSFGNSGSSIRTGSPVDLVEEPLSRFNIAELCNLTDRLQDAYKDEITMLKNKGRPLYTSDPRPPTEVEAGQSVHVDYNWRESYGGSALGSGPQTVGRPTPHDELPPSYPDDKPRAQQSPTFTEDSDTIGRTLDHRDSVKEYLQGQFYLQQTYSEHIHWRRVRQIGHGGQAKCFCIEDCVNNYALCLKEEVENKKALDEAFICLTLARLVSDAPPNIVEFFGASILPHYSGSNRLQLFLELMPGCLQEYVFENGPLPPDTTLNFSFQLFEALDYLHQELRVIHCDIKPANLLIDYNCQRLKVADFGCAELLDEACHRKGFPENKDAGTLWYNPPDFYCSGNCSFGMDIWQAGCSVLFMVTGRRPWRHLCMDVDKQKAGPGLAGLLKKRCCQIIGEQNERLHPLPAFLTSRAGEGGMAEGGAGVRQLLVGCLQPASSRLSAKDLAYLAAVSETTSQYQRSRIVRQLGYSPNLAVLDRLQRESHTHQSMVDIYLGKEMLRADINSMPHAMLNGWLGSVPHRNGMTYSDLLNLARQHIPVIEHFGEVALSVHHDDPRLVWKAVASGAKPHRVRPSHQVDPTRALLLHPVSTQTTCC